MLTKASRLGDLKTANSLLSAGVDPNLANQYGRTPLYYAALFDNNDVAALLLAHHANPNTRTSGKTPDNEFPQTPLQVAASMGNFRMASMLITAGAHVDIRSEEGRTAPHFAVVANHLDMIRLLIEKGADVNIRDASGASPLEDASLAGFVAVVEMLLDHGGSKDCKTR